MSRLGEAPYDRYAPPTRGPLRGKSRAEKHRHRKVGSRDARVAARLDGLQRIIEALRPVPQRTVFYRATEVLAEAYPKTDSAVARRSAQKMSEDVNILRRQGRIDWNDVTDMVSAEYQDGWNGVTSVLDALSRSYQHDYWSVAQQRIAVSIESEQLWSALVPRLDDLPTPLFGLGGLPSLPTKVELADWLGQSADRPVLLHVGDHDGQGWEIERTLGDGLAEHGVDADVRRILMYGSQGDDLGLPSRILSTASEKAMDEAWGFTTGSRIYEAEAMDPADIAGLVRTEVTRLLDPVVTRKVGARRDECRARFRVLTAEETAT